MLKSMKSSAIACVISLSVPILNATTVVVIEPTPTDPGPNVSSPVGYSEEGVGQSVLITPPADGLILGSFAFMNGTIPVLGVIDETAPLYVFRQEFRGSSASLKVTEIGTVGGPVGIGYWDGTNGFNFTNQEIALSEGQRLWFYTDSFTTMALYQDGYDEGDFYAADEGGNFGDPLLPEAAMIDFDLQFRMVAVPEPGAIGLALLGLLGLTKRRRISGVIR